MSRKGSTVPTAARTVRLWVADSGALDEPIGPSTLVTDETLTANYKTAKPPGARTCAEMRQR